MEQKLPYFQSVIDNLEWCDDPGSTCSIPIARSNAFRRIIDPQKKSQPRAVGFFVGLC
jgi:hypothetical protein